MKLRQPRKCKPESDSDKPDNEGDDEAEDADDEGDNSQRVVRTPASPDLYATLLSVDVDEVCTALIEAWDEQHIRDLCDRLRDHFTKPAPTRQPLPLPTLS
jgi:hypothetical protein